MQYWADVLNIESAADKKRARAVLISLGITGGNGALDKGVEYWGGEWLLAPLVEVLDMGVFTYENVQIDNEVNEQIELVKKRLNCK